MDDTYNKHPFRLDSDTETIIHLFYEDPLSFSNIQSKFQIFQGGVNVTGQKFSVSLVFRVIKSTWTYNMSDDTINF